MMLTTLAEQAVGAVSGETTDLALRLVGAPVSFGAVALAVYRLVILPGMDRWKAMQGDRIQWERERMDKSLKLQEGHQALTLTLNEGVQNCRELVRECREYHESNKAAAASAAHSNN